MTSQALGGGEFALRLVLRQRVAPPYWRSDTHTHTHPAAKNKNATAYLTMPYWCFYLGAVQLA